MLSDLCREQFDFAWRRPTPQPTDSEDVHDILQQTSSVVAAVDVRHYNRDTLSAAVGGVIQTGGYSYGRCMKVLRRAVCGPKVCHTHTTILRPLVGCVAEWLERRSLTGELSLASARSAADV